MLTWGQLFAGITATADEMMSPVSINGPMFVKLVIPKKTAVIRVALAGTESSSDATFGDASFTASAKKIIIIILCSGTFFYCISS